MEGSMHPKNLTLPLALLFAGLIGTTSTTFAQDGTATDLQDVPALTEVENPGNPLAEMSLRDLRLRAVGEQTDEADAAIAELERRSSSDADAALNLAEVLIAGGSSRPKDIPAAIPYLEFAANAGDARARRRLADAYRAESPAQDLVKSYENYKILADDGDAQSSYRVAEFLRTGSAVPKDLEASINYYQIAADAGNNDALMRLATGLLKETLVSGRSAEGYSLLEKAAEGNVAGAASTLGEALVRGTGTTRDVTRGLEILTTAADNGDVTSARLLIRWYTTGSLSGVARSIPDAQRTLEALSATDNPAIVAFEAVIVDSAVASGTGSYSGVAQKFELLGASSKRTALSRIFSLDRNLYVYLIQAHLADQGLYSGSLNGLLTSTTIRAINELCSDKDISEVCRMGPLSGPARRAIAEVAFP